MRRFAPIFLVLILIWIVPGFAQKGRIEGTVVDAETGKPLPGVNVIVKGTYKGAATDEKGHFIIYGLSPGDYDIEAQMIGYTTQLQTGVRVLAGRTTKIQFKLKQTVLALGQSIEIVGERPLLEVDVTASQHVMQAKDIAQKIVRDVGDIVAQELGVVKENNQIHIRGGRADESMYIVDGQSVKDPLSGYTNTLYINAGAIEELKIITGGFNAEYGQAMSGIIDVKTKEGSSSFEGDFSWESDHRIPGSFFKGFNTDELEINFGGPEPFTQFLLPAIGLRLPGEMTFFISGYVHLTDTYLPHANRLYPYKSYYSRLAPREENDWHVLGKVAWKIRPGQKLAISYNRSLNINQGYFLPRIEGGRYFPYRYSKMLDHYNTITKEAVLTTVEWVHTLSPTTFYELSLGRFFTSLHSAVRNKHWTEYQENLDTEPVIYIVDSRGNVQTRFGDGFYDTGDANRWYDYYSDNWSLNGSITSNLHAKHQVKAGFELRYTEMQVVDIIDPWIGESGLGRNHDAYRVYPNDGAFFIQDRITYSGMIVNIGLRYDYWFPGEYVEDAINDPETVTITDAARKLFKKETFKFLGHRGKGHLSPRLGISHPVTDNDVLYMHYGHFSQKPIGQYVYAKLKSHSEATYQLFGNPNLNPTTTVAYELGLKHRFNRNQTIEFKAYYKDMFDYPTAVRVQKFSPRLGNISYYMYVNMDYARSRGIEIRFRRRSRYLSGNIDFTYAVATGKSSTPNTNLLVAAGRVPEKPLTESYLRWDKPYRFSTDIFFYMPEDARFYFMGLRIPTRWGFNLRFEYESGKRYRRLIDVERNIYEKDEYGSISKPWSRLDLRLYKDFTLLGVEWSIYLEAENVFNTKIPRIINPVTGRPYEPGDIIPRTWHDDPRDLPPDNPARYDWPRQVKLGIRMRFE